MRKIVVVCFLVLLGFIVAALPNRVFATAETRYVLKTQQTINTVTGYELETSGLGSAPAKATYVMRTYAEGDWGVRIYKVSSGGSKTELTSGVSATVHKDGAGSAELSNTWNCPQTALATTDAVEVDWYIYDDIVYYDWVFAMISITEQVQNWAEPDPNQLDAATWTIYYHIGVVWNALDACYRSYLYWGTATYDTRIGNFSYSVVAGETTLNLYGTISQKWTINHQNTWSFSRTSTINQKYTIQTQSLIARLLNFYGSIAQTYQILTQRTWQFTLNPFIQQSFSIDSMKEWAFSIVSTIQQVFTLETLREFISGTIISISGSIGQTFNIESMIQGLLPTEGLPLLLPFLIIAAMIVLCVSIYVRKQQRQNK